MAVSKETAAALAAKYPRLAAHVAGAEALAVEEQTANVRGQAVVVARFRRYRVGGQTVVLDEAEAPPTVTVSVGAGFQTRDDMVSSIAAATDAIQKRPAPVAPQPVADEFTPVPLSVPADQPAPRAPAPTSSGGKHKR